MINFQTKTDVIPVTTPTTTKLSGAIEFNSIATETKNVVSRSGQTLAPFDGPDIDQEQLPRAVNINSIAAQTYQDSGVANAYQLTPVTGLNGLVVPDDYSQFAGAIITFQAANVNSGASTINIGQSTGSLLGARPLVDASGSALIGGEISAGDRIQCLYDLSVGGGSWLLIGKYSLISVPIGGTIIWHLDTIPPDYLIADGSSLLTANYQELFTVLGYTYGGSGATFNLPNLQGYFLRGWDNAEGNDPDAASRTDRGDGTTGDNVGTKQEDAFQGHWHATAISDYVAGGGIGAPRYAFPSAAITTSWPAARQASTDGTHGDPRISSETRSKNINVLFCIRYQ